MKIGMYSGLPACPGDSHYNHTEPLLMHFKHSTNFGFLLFGLLIANLISVAAFAQVAASTCGPITVQGQFGPFDYRTDKSKLSIVESFHFTPAVEALSRGKSTF